VTKREVFCGRLRIRGGIAVSRKFCTKGKKIVQEKYSVFVDRQEMASFSKKGGGGTNTGRGKPKREFLVGQLSDKCLRELATSVRTKERVF